MIELAKFGDRPAIEEASGTIVTYAELDALAQRYRTSNVVEVETERSARFIARCLGAWLGGGAFVPFDRTDPRPRPPVTHAPGLAYAIGTSGSAGIAKRVLVGHAGIPALLRAQIDAFALGPGDRALWLHAPVFDASISDWGTALASGATLVIPTTKVFADIEREIATRAITHVDLPPSLLARLTDPPPCLRVVVLGGEPSDVSRVRALARRVRVVVVYGPTEATVCSSLVVVDPDRWERPLIGEPLPGVTYRVIDGELYIGGDAVALGYTDPEETARRFVEIDGARMYRTGDRIEPTQYGLAFIGRTDRQIKLAGKRVDLDDVEATLRRFAPNAAVVVNDGRLVAFVDEPVRRATLRGALPSWMQPRRIVVGALPRTPTGKIDRAALVEPPVAWPADPIERAWCQALGVDSVRASDRFSECGGDSLARLVLHAATDIVVEGDPTFAEFVASRAPLPLTVAECEARGRAMLPTRGAGPTGDAILITGGYGFLAGHLIDSLTRRGRVVIALVREVVSSIGTGQVIGDITHPRLGLDDETFAMVHAKVGTVIHCAATIQLGGNWNAHAAANVRGTAEVARFAGDRPWHHISTLSVFVNTDRRHGRHEEQQTPSPDALVYGGYAQTKVAAEAIARASGVSIYRLGLLVGNPLDQRDRTLRALAKLGAVPAGFLDRRYDETPVAYAANAIAALVERGDQRTYHIAASRSTALRDVIDLPELPHAVWLERARARIGDRDIAMAIGAFSGRPDLDLFLATDADFAVERTAALLSSLGVER